MTDSVPGKHPYWMCIHFHTCFCITFSHLKCFKVIKVTLKPGDTRKPAVEEPAVRRFSKFKFSIVRSVTQLQAALLWNRPEARNQKEKFSLREAWPGTSFSSECSRKQRWRESSIVREGGGGRSGATSFSTWDSSCSRTSPTEVAGGPGMVLVSDPCGVLQAGVRRLNGWIIRNKSYIMKLVNISCILCWKLHMSFASKVLIKMFFFKNKT